MDQTTGQAPPTSAQPSTQTDSSSTTAKPEGTKDETSPFNKKPDGEGEGEKAPEGAPEKYEDFKVPDGYKLDEEMATEASALFKKMNLSQPQAQELVDLYVKRTTEAFEAPFKAFADMKQKWTDEVMTTYGKDIEPGGKHFKAVGGLLSALGPLEAPFREAMDQTGVGSNPAFVKAFIKLAEMLGEGTPTTQGRGPSPLGQAAGGTAERPSAASAIYPHLPSAS